MKDVCLTPTVALIKHVATQCVFPGKAAPDEAVRWTRIVLLTKFAVIQNVFKGSSCLGQRCTFDSDCSANQACCNSKCITGKNCLRQSCDFNSDCSSGQSCCSANCTNGLTCIGKSCISDKNCQATEICCRGTCSIVGCKDSGLVGYIVGPIAAFLVILLIIAIFFLYRQRNVKRRQLMSSDQTSNITAPKLHNTEVTSSITGQDNPLYQLQRPPSDQQTEHLNTERIQLPQYT